MKTAITITTMALLLPVAAVGEVSVTCDDCTHEVSVYMGSGGFIATADGTDMVTYVSTCGGVTRSGEIAAGADGVVSMLFGDAACEMEGGSFELGPVKDGGWYWITDDMNSAVGNLVNMDILANVETTITSAGDGVTMTMGEGAVLLKELSTGRVGILPTILPAPPMDPPAVCGPRYSAATRGYTEQQMSSCMLGDGGTRIALWAPGTYGGHTALTGGAVYRKTDGPVVIMADLWVNESGSFASGETDANAGWAGKGTGNHLAGVGWTTSLAGASPGATLDGAGVSVGDSDTNGQAELTISPSTGYCPASGAQTTATVNILAWPTGTPGATTGGDTADITPALATQRALGGAYQATQIRVMCAPSSSANMGQELVPENPFPTDE